jgi:Domain of unknown function (DUF4375)
MPIHIRRLVPLRPGIRATRHLLGTCSQLVAMPPESASANQLRADFEHTLMRLLAGGGLRKTEQIVRDLTRSGLPLALVDKRPGHRSWTGIVPPRNAELRITLTANRLFRTSHVSWRAMLPPASTPPQTVISSLQAAFYTRYMAAGARAYSTPPGRLAPVDRLILQVGEFEADVNNGGFQQFLGNKGKRRAQATLRALRKIGAGKTLRLLATALKPSAKEAVWARLDRQYDRTGEDLAVLAMRYVAMPHRAGA